MLKRVYRCAKCGAIEEVLEGWEIVGRMCGECGEPMKVLLQSPRIIAETGPKT